MSHEKVKGEETMHNTNSDVPRFALALLACSCPPFFKNVFSQEFSEIKLLEFPVATSERDSFQDLPIACR